MHRKVSRTWIAAIVFALSALFIAQSLADDAIAPAEDPLLAPIVEAIVTPDAPTPAPEVTPTPDLSPSPSASASADAIPSESASATDTASPSPSKTPPHAIANQFIFVRTANAVHVDPRANSALITEVQLSSPSILLACLSSSSALLDVLVKNSVDNIEPDTLIGDVTNFIRISGTSSQVMNIINSFDGIRARSFSRSIAYQHLLLRFVAVSEPTLDAKLCNDGSPSNNRIIHINPFGIDIEMKKADVRLAK